ncbi:MAG: HAD-IC family P-type ATPase [Thiolinea sp.]
MLDKTGTLTQGKPTSTPSMWPGRMKITSLQIAASLERSGTPACCDHPRCCTGKRLTGFAGASVQRHRRAGVEADVAGQPYRIGNTRLMQQQGLALDAWQASLQALDQQGQTPVFLADHERILALFGIADALGRGCAGSIQRLRALGLEVIILTGDRREVAEHIAREVGIETLHAEVLPADKSQVVADLQAQGHKVAMVGDGVNDAPALAQADIGIAIGAGTDVAIAAADVTDGQPLRGIADAIAISRATHRNIWQNLFGAFIYNSLGIPIAAGVLHLVHRTAAEPDDRRGGDGAVVGNGGDQRESTVKAENPLIT